MSHIIKAFFGIVSVALLAMCTAILMIEHGRPFKFIAVWVIGLLVAALIPLCEYLTGAIESGRSTGKGAGE